MSGAQMNRVYNRI